MIVIHNDFFPEFEKLQSIVRSLTYQGMVNPKDGVWYPHINIAIPERWLNYMVECLDAKGYTAFLRLTTENTNAPHQAHNDSIMGEFTAIAYMNPGEGGTSLLKHKKYDWRYGVPIEDAELWKQETNKYDRWEIVEMIKNEPNKLVTYPSNYMHRAEPVNGFGKTPHDGRLVLTMFYNQR